MTKPTQTLEQALLCELQTVDVLPLEFIIKPRIVVSRATGEAILDEINSAKPTAALRMLMRDAEGQLPPGGS